jgi:hypothetical protein
MAKPMIAQEDGFFNESILRNDVAIFQALFSGRSSEVEHFN